MLTCLQGTAGARHGVLNAVKATPAFQRLALFIVEKRLFRTQNTSPSTEVGGGFSMFGERKLASTAKPWVGTRVFFQTISSLSPTHRQLPSLFLLLLQQYSHFLSYINKEQHSFCQPWSQPSVLLQCVSRGRIRCRIIIIIFIMVL